MQISGERVFKARGQQVQRSQDDNILSTFKKHHGGNSLAVYWLGLCFFTAFTRGPGFDTWSGNKESGRR